MFKIYRTKWFEELCRKELSTEEQKQVENFEQTQLIFNPYVGDPLGYPFFREKKIRGKRIYYLIYKEFHAVLMTNISTKKDQQEVIREIKERLPLYYSIILEAIKQHDGSCHV